MQRQHPIAARMLAAVAYVSFCIATAAARSLGIQGASNDWLPSKDADLVGFSESFYANILASPGTYGLVAGDATALLPVVTAFTDAMDLLADPATNTSPNVAAKNAARAALKTMLRDLAARVQADVAVSDEAKETLGLTVRNNTPSPIPAPATFPLLQIVRSNPLSLELRYSDSDTPDSIRKPSGAIGLELRAETSATAISDPTAIAYWGVETRNPVQMNWDAADANKVAYIAARWVTARGLVGPWSAITEYTVPQA